MLILDESSRRPLLFGGRSIYDAKGWSRYGAALSWILRSVQNDNDGRVFLKIAGLIHSRNQFLCPFLVFTVAIAKLDGHELLFYSYPMTIAE